MPIRGVHGDDPRHHTLQKPYRVVTADERVRRIVLDAETRRIDALEDLPEDVFGLREFGMLPGSIFVMIFQTEHDVAALGVLERAAQRVDSPGDPLASRQTGSPLPAERAAEFRAEPYGQIDRRPL